MVQVALTISETIDSFTPAKQENLKGALRDEMGCHEPSCFLELKISGGSISVAAVLTIPDDAPDGVDAATLAASVETAATQLVANIREIGRLFGLRRRRIGSITCRRLQWRAVAAIGFGFCDRIGQDRARHIADDERRGPSGRGPRSHN